MTVKITLQITPIILDKSMTTAEFGNVIIPAYNAFLDSPHWRPVLVKDGTIYAWKNGRGVYDPENRQLFYTTRAGKIILLNNVRGIPGGRIANVMKEPELETLLYGELRREVAIAALLFRHILKEVKFKGIIATNIEEGKAAVFKIEETEKTKKADGEILATAYRLHRWYPVFVLYIHYTGDMGETWKRFIDAVRRVLPQYLRKPLDEQIKIIEQHKKQYSHS